MMADNAALDTVRSVSIGRVYGRAFRAIAANPLVIVGVALLFTVLPQLATRGLVLLGSPDEVGVFLAVAVLTALSYLVSLVFAVLAQGALVRATVAASEGRRAGFGESLGAALPVVLPLIGLGLVVSIGVVLGFLFFVVPGIMLYIFWVVAAPVLVEERVGVLGAIKRSRELTRGARWTVFALLLTAAILYALLTIVGGLLVLAIGFQNLVALTGSWFVFVGGTIVGTIITALWSVIISSLYVELREWKEGPADRALADVFA